MVWKYDESWPASVVLLKLVGSSVKIDEKWSKVVLKVVAFSQGVVAPFQVRLVNEIGGS